FGLVHIHHHHPALRPLGGREMFLDEGLPGDPQSVRIAAMVAPVLGQGLTKLGAPLQQSNVAYLLSDLQHARTRTAFDDLPDGDPVTVWVSGQRERTAGERDLIGRDED